MKCEEACKGCGSMVLKPVEEGIGQQDGMSTKRLGTCVVGAYEVQGGRTRGIYI